MKRLIVIILLCSFYTCDAQMLNGSALQYHYNSGASPLLLDNYPNDSVAFSASKLSLYAPDSCWLVRRSSDDATMAIGWSGNNLDTATLKTFLGSSDGFLQVWYDQSGHRNNLYQTTNSQQPQIAIAGVIIRVNSLPAVKFIAGNSTYFNLTRAISGATVWSSFSCMKRSTDTSTMIGLSSNDLVKGVPFTIILHNTGLTMGANRIRQYYYNDAKTVSFRLLTSIGFTSSFAMYANSALKSISFVALAYTGNFDLFGSSPMNSTFSDGYVSEQILYLSDQTSNRVAIETNINNRYSIY